MPHIHDLIDFTVEVFVVYNNRVLLRKHDKYKKWLSVGGHVELNEDPNHAAIREVKEEVGLDIELNKKLLPFELNSKDYTELIPPNFMNRHRISESHEHITFVYFASSGTDKTILSETEASDGIRWLSKEELEKTDELDLQIKFYALKALETLKI